MTIPEFAPRRDDPLAPEHAAITRWIQDAEGSYDHALWRAVDLKAQDSGRVLLDSSPQEAKRLLLAAMVQTQHFEEECVRAGVFSSWKKAWGPYRHAVHTVSALLRRSLLFDRNEIIELLRWSAEVHRKTAEAPLGHVKKALERFAEGNEIDLELLDAMQSFAAMLRSSGDKNTHRLGTDIEQLCARTPEAQSSGAPANVRPSPVAAPAGGSMIFRRVKLKLGMLTHDSSATVETGPDRFEMPLESPLAREHERLTELLNQVVGNPGYHSPDLEKSSSGREILALTGSERGLVLLAAAERHMAALLAPNPSVDQPRVWQSRYALAGIAKTLTLSPVQFEREGLFDLVLYQAIRPAHQRAGNDLDCHLLTAVAQVTNGGQNLTGGERFILHLWRASRIVGPLLGVASTDVDQLTEWIGDGARYYLVPGELWSDAVNADLAAMDAAKRLKWVVLFRHFLTATSARPSAKWLKTAAKLASELDSGELRQSMERWLALVPKGRSIAQWQSFPGDTRTSGDLIHDENATALRGILWLVGSSSFRAELARLVATLAISAYRKVPGIGPRAVKVGNAAVYALSEIKSPESIGQLAMLKVRVRFGTAQKEIEKAFDAVATALELPRDQIEELSVPCCGLESVGQRREEVGDYRAELTVTGNDADVKWIDASGKLLKAAPAIVKKENGEILKDLQQSLKDVRGMLSAQTDRLDALFLERKSWPASIWRERYLDHPLVGTIARRLIWCVGDTPAICIDGQLFDIQGTRLDVPDGAQITLWHPAGRSIDEIVAWRGRIEELGIVQPFKQAHREVYLLTDAERRTSTYSNRFAAHIIRQHQFNALCAARRWKNKLRLMVDDVYPPASRELAPWGLRAEFWVEGVGEEYGADTNDSGVFLRLASDQVRFYRTGAATNYAHAGGGGYRTRAAGPGVDDISEPLTLDEIPALVFSEVMRDVDLFVGVASIGNDPMWQDGGPAGRYVDYWHNYAFGELSATAVTRREILERLIPRLKIAGRCTIADRFLIVRGDRRTYKIHLGSGNILMEPNDQYLCIVPDAHARMRDTQVYLPFEGDATLSIILSKAFLLAEDSKIKDDIINRQIDGR